MADFRRKTPGSPFVIPAATYNAFVDAAVAHAGRGTSATRTPRKPDTRDGIVLLRNDSGAACERYAVLGLSAPIIHPYDNQEEFESRVTFAGVVPAESHVRRFAILLEPIPAGETGRAMILGVCPVMVAVQHESHEYAEAAVGDSAMLHSAASGAAQILWWQDIEERDDPAYAWAVVRVGGGGGAAPSGCGLFAIYSIVDGVILAREIVDGEMAEPIEVYPLPGHTAESYQVDALIWGVGDELDATLIPCMGVKVGDKWYITPTHPPLGSNLPAGADYGV